MVAPGKSGLRLWRVLSSARRGTGPFRTRPRMPACCCPVDCLFAFDGSAGGGHAAPEAITPRLCRIVEALSCCAARWRSFFTTAGCTILRELMLATAVSAVEPLEARLLRYVLRRERRIIA